MTVRGLNHVTLAVADLARAVSFYTEGVGLVLAKRWAGGAYLTTGELWLCLSVDSAAPRAPYPDYTHLAFDVAAEDFAAAKERLLALGATSWKDNRSEGASFYFLDPDGHKLELHVGDLASRLAAMRDCA